MIHAKTDVVLDYIFFKEKPNDFILRSMWTEIIRKTREKDHWQSSKKQLFVHIRANVSSTTKKKAI